MMYLLVTGPLIGDPQRRVIAELNAAQQEINQFLRERTDLHAAWVRIERLQRWSQILGDALALLRLRK